MPGSIFTSKASALLRALTALAVSLTALAFHPRAAHAAPNSSGDDYSETPFTEYGEFNEEEEEADEAKFFQYGRFFGVSVGSGFQGATGNRGLLYQGGFPTLDIKVHYWF